MLLTKAEELREFRKSGELSDICVIVNKTEFNLHKFPLFLSSEFFRALCRCGMMDENKVTLQQFPGGEKTFALIADYCYGLEIDINSKNVVELRCAADFLQIMSLASETTSALNQILPRQPIAVVDILNSACRLGEIASHTNILSPCFNAVFKLMNKCEGNISGKIFEALLELPIEWFISLIIGARDAGIAVPKITRLVGRYIERIVRKNKVCINKYLECRSSDDEECPRVIKPDMMSVQDLGEILDAILLELPKTSSLSKVLDTELLCLLYRLAVQLRCKCEGMLLAVIGTNLCKIPHEILVAMPTSDVISIVEHTVNSNTVTPAALCKTIDCYLWQRTKQKHITLEEFDAVVRATPTSYRTQHDSILLITEELLSGKVSEEMKLKTLDLIDMYKLHENTLREVSKRNVIPSTFIVSSALAVSSRLRNELTEVKAKLGEKDNDIRDIHTSISDAIQGQWKCNDVTLNVTPKDEINTRVQFAKVLARDPCGGLRMEHEVYDGKLTLCVKSRATSTKSCETSTKTFLFDPFNKQLVELTRSKHDNVMVGEHYEKKIHSSPYWPFMDVTTEPWNMVAIT